MHRGRRTYSISNARFWLLALAVALLTACGTAPNGPSEENPSNGPEDLESSLNELGVDTTKSPRVDPDGEDLPSEYAPLGAGASFGDEAEFSDGTGANASMELLLAGLVGSSAFKLLEIEGAQVSSGGDIDPGTMEVLHALSEDENPWVRDYEMRTDRANDAYVGTTLREVAAGDIDDDGREELVAVFVDKSTTTPVLRIKIIEDQEERYSATEDTIANGEGVLDVNVAVGDFDGEGSGQVVVALSREGSTEVLFLNDDGGGDYAVESALTKTYGSPSADGVFTLELATGNLDYDKAVELVVVVNELIDPPDQGDSATSGVATLYVYDDQDSSFALLRDVVVSGVDPDAGSYSVQVADVDLGDIDGDGMDEIVLAGVTEFDNYCGNPQLVVALDDAEGELEPLASRYSANPFEPGSCGIHWGTFFVHVNAFDLDGDGLDEVQANQLIYEDLTESSGFEQIHRLPDDVLLNCCPDGGNDDNGSHLNANTFSVVSGDMTGDGREDLVTWSQYQQHIRIFGKTSVSAVGDEGFAELSRVNYARTTHFADPPPRPMLLPVNLDDDSPVLSYSPGSYELVFTEPILVAALAAAPCSEGIGQNLGACSTVFGEAESDTISSEVTVSTKASTYVGVKTAVNIPWVGEVGADFKATVSRTASLSTGSSYTVTKSEVFTTGPLEDSVIFTTIPYDTYIYDILVHPDPEMVGGTVTVSQPREPVMLKVEREFYNESLSGTSMAVGSNVFDHAVGDLSSYPSPGRKDDLLEQYADNRAGIDIDILDLQNGPQVVGQGSGSTGRSIDVATSVSAGGSLGVEFEASVDVTAGPALAGFSVGAGVTSSLQLSSGDSTTYSVTVGDLDLAAEEYSANRYGYGIFTYVQEIEGQEFQVVNFWVE